MALGGIRSDKHVPVQGFRLRPEGRSNVPFRSDPKGEGSNVGGIWHDDSISSFRCLLSMHNTKTLPLNSTDDDEEELCK